MRFRLDVNPWLVDALLAGAVLAIGLYEALTADEAGSRELRVLAMVLVSAPLIVRRRYPLLALLVFVSGLVLEGLTMDPLNSLAELLAGLLLAYSVPRYLPSDRAVLGIPLLVIGIGVHRIASPGSEAVDFIFDAAFVTAAWALGRAARRREERAEELARRAAQLEEEQARAAHEAALAERLRIARELHDIVAHALGVVAVQAGAAEQVLSSDPARARTALGEIRATAREAVVEMRRLLGVLRAAEEVQLGPQPSLARLDELLEPVRMAGVDVDVVFEGTPRPLPPGVELSAFRILQEALTNVLKHARASRADVVIRYQPDALDLEVRDDGAGSGDGDPGHGLIGVRERVALHDGMLEAGPRPGGGFGLHAILPLRSGMA